MGANLETLRRHTATTADGVPMETVFIRAETEADIPEPQEKWALGSVCWCIGTATWYGLSGGEWIDQSTGNARGTASSAQAQTAAVDSISPAIQRGNLMTSDVLSPDTAERVSDVQEDEPEEITPADDAQDEPSLVDYLNNEEDVADAESDGHSESE